MIIVEPTPRPRAQGSKVPTARASRPGHDDGGRRLPVRDVLWSGYHYVVLVGPMRGLSASCLRSSLARHALDVPALAMRRSPDGLSWLTVPERGLGDHLEALVLAQPLSGGTEDVETLLAQPLDGLPVRLVVGGDHLAIHTDHAFADATSVNDFQVWLAKQAVGMDAPPPARPVGLLSPHRVALSHTFGRTLPVAALKDTATTVLAERRRHALLPPPPAWDGRPSVEFVAGGSAGTAAVREFRRAHAPGMSGGMVIMAAVWWSLLQHGVVPADLRPGIGLDLRRYLPRRSWVDGNFTTSVRLPEGTRPHPVLLRDALGAYADTGEPLIAASAQVALGTLRSRLAAVRGHGPDLPARHAESGPVSTGHHAPSLVLNFMGRASGWDPLPWSSGSPEIFSAAPSVDSSRAVTVNIHDRSDGFHVSASFFASVTPRAAVRAALEDLKLALPDVLAAMHEAHGG